MNKNIRARLDCTPKYIAAISEYDGEEERISDFEVIKYSDLVQLLEDINGSFVEDENLKRQHEALKGTYRSVCTEFDELHDEFNAYKDEAEETIKLLREKLDKYKLVVNAVEKLLNVKLMEV